MKKQLERNIQLYGFLKIFTKRVFLPLTTIYLADVAGLTIKEIGLLASLSAVVSLASDVPTGFIADKFGRRLALIFASSLAVCGALTYAFFPSMQGAIVAVILESLAYSFLSGAGEALMYDTLHNLDRVDDYPKIAGRAQSLGLIGNTALVLLVPLTYTVDPSYPFIIGALCYAALFFIVLGMHEPERIVSQTKHNFAVDLYKSFRVFVNRFTVAVFLCIGLLSSLSATSDFLNLSLKDMGLDPQFMGIAYVGGSILGIIGGYFIHHLRNKSLRFFILLDLLTSVSLFAIIGLTKNLWLAIALFWINMGIFRLRNIMYQYHLLRVFKDNAYKATLISVMSVFGRANEVWIPLALMSVIGAMGYYNGFVALSIVLMAVLTPLSFYSTYRLNLFVSKS